MKRIELKYENVCKEINPMLLKTIDYISNYGFRIVKDSDGIITFFNDSTKIILELGDDLKCYKLIYTNKEMLGFLDSGKFDDITNEPMFQQTLSQFKETVRVLQAHYDPEKEDGYFE